MFYITCRHLLLDYIGVKKTTCSDVDFTSSERLWPTYDCQWCQQCFCVKTDEDVLLRSFTLYAFDGARPDSGTGACSTIGVLLETQPAKAGLPHWFIDSVESSFKDIQRPPSNCHAWGWPSHGALLRPSMSRGRMGSKNGWTIWTKTMQHRSRPGLTNDKGLHHVHLLGMFVNSFDNKWKPIIYI